GAEAAPAVEIQRDLVKRLPLEQQIADGPFKVAFADIGKSRVAVVATQVTHVQFKAGARTVNLVHCETDTFVLVVAVEQLPVQIELAIKATLGAPHIDSNFAFRRR